MQARDREGEQAKDKLDWVEGFAGLNRFPIRTFPSMDDFCLLMITRSSRMPVIREHNPNHVFPPYEYAMTEPRLRRQVVTTFHESFRQPYRPLAINAFFVRFLMSVFSPSPL